MAVRRRFVVFWLLAVPLLLAAMVGFLSVPSGAESRWSSDFGPLTLWVDKDGAVTGRYEDYDGRIDATYHPDVRLIVGTWLQPTSDSPCSVERDGTAAWGWVEFSVEGDDRLRGVWGYCDDPVDDRRVWNASLVGGVLPAEKLR